MDSADIRVLRELQRDAKRPIREIAKAAGVSQTHAWRRLKALEAAGIVESVVAIVNARKVGLGLTVFVQICTNVHKQSWLEEFARRTAAFPEVTECYRMGGATDYLLKVVVPDIAGYDKFYRKLIEMPGISDVSAGFAMEQLKFTTELPMNLVSAD